VKPDEVGVVVVVALVLSILVITPFVEGGNGRMVISSRPKP
jgi:hypothetical protein